MPIAKYGGGGGLKGLGSGLKGLGRCLKECRKTERGRPVDKGHVWVNY